jgi:hypothetical protein
LIVESRVLSLFKAFSGDLDCAWLCSLPCKQGRAGEGLSELAAIVKASPHPHLPCCT